jgi:hypothetical protein
LAQGIEMRQRLRSQKVHELGCRLDHLFHGWIFGVQNSKWIGVQTAFGIFVKHILVLFKVRNESCPVGQSLWRLPQAVELESNLFEANGFP